MDSKGVLYIATGRKYVKAAIRSAKTVHKQCCDLAIHLFTDPKNYDEFKFKDSSSPFTSVTPIENPHRRSKVDFMSKTPFDQTLYLDTDTAVVADINGMFQLLDRFDIALAHAQHRNAPVNLAPWRIELPPAFPQFNSGVILYRKNPAMTNFFETWSMNFQEAGFRHDQPTLRELLWLSDLRIATLPPEYNVRFIKYFFLWSKSEATPKIYHLKQFHKGWLVWFNRKSNATRTVRRLGMGWLVDLVKKAKK